MQKEYCEKVKHLICLGCGNCGKPLPSDDVLDAVHEFAIAIRRRFIYDKEKQERCFGEGNSKFTPGYVRALMIVDETIEDYRDYKKGMASNLRA